MSGTFAFPIQRIPTKEIGTLSITRLEQGYMFKADFGEEDATEILSREELVCMNKNFATMDFDPSILCTVNGKIELDEMRSMGCQVSLLNHKGFVFDIPEESYEGFKEAIRTLLKESRWFP